MFSSDGSGAAPAYAPSSSPYVYQPAVSVSGLPAVAETAAPDTGDETAAALVDDVPAKTKWSGNANLGASLQTGNTEQDAINADATIYAEFSEKHQGTLRAEYARESDNGSTTEDNRSLELEYDYFYKPKWFIETSLGLEQDRIEQLDLRTNAGVGLGYQPYKSDDLRLKFVAGPTYFREDFENGTTNTSLAFRESTDYQQKILEKKLTLFHNHELFVPSDDTGAFLFESRSGLRVPIYKNITATGEVAFDWDNDPEPGVVEDDTTYSAKIGYQWGN